MENTHPAMKQFEKIGDLLVGITGLMGILIMTISVVFRYVFKISISWSDELLRTTCIYLYFVGSALIYNEGGLMRLELTESMLLKKGKIAVCCALRKIQRVLEVVFFGALSYEMIQMVLGMVISGQTTTTSSTPAWISPLGCGIGVVMIAIFAVVKLISKEPLPVSEEITE